jgi:predicted GIY-YIG superfamily endonuclease
MSSQTLYRFFGSDGSLLYIGITMDPPARWRQHRSDKEWWAKVRNVTLEPYATRSEVLAAERDAIRREGPQYNVIHNNHQITHLPAPSPFLDVDAVIGHCTRQEWRLVYVRQLREISKAHPGLTPIKMRVQYERFSVLASDGYGTLPVRVTPSFVTDMKDLFGPSCFAPESAPMRESGLAYFDPPLHPSLLRSLSVSGSA